jgi:hypothetical protein
MMSPTTEPQPQPQQPQTQSNPTAPRRRVTFAETKLKKARLNGLEIEYERGTHWADIIKQAPDNDQTRPLKRQLKGLQTIARKDAQQPAWDRQGRKVSRLELTSRNTKGILENPAQIVRQSALVRRDILYWNRFFECRPIDFMLIHARDGFNRRLNWLSDQKIVSHSSADSRSRNTTIFRSALHQPTVFDEVRQILEGLPFSCAEWRHEIISRAVARPKEFLNHYSRLKERLKIESPEPGDEVFFVNVMTDPSLLENTKFVETATTLRRLGLTASVYFDLVLHDKTVALEDLETHHEVLRRLGLDRYSDFATILIESFLTQPNKFTEVHDNIVKIKMSAADLLQAVQDTKRFDANFDKMQQIHDMLNNAKDKFYDDNLKDNALLHVDPGKQRFFEYAAMVKATAFDYFMGQYTNGGLRTKLIEHQNHLLKQFPKKNGLFKTKLPEGLRKLLCVLTNAIFTICTLGVGPTVSAVVNRKKTSPRSQQWFPLFSAPKHEKNLQAITQSAFNTATAPSVR